MDELRSTLQMNVYYESGGFNDVFSNFFFFKLQTQAVGSTLKFKTKKLIVDLFFKILVFVRIMRICLIDHGMIVVATVINPEVSFLVKWIQYSGDIVCFKNVWTTTTFHTIIQKVLIWISSCHDNHVIRTKPYLESRH